MKHVPKIKNKILSYYIDNKRSLPWRTKDDNDQNPYYTLVSEIMLQQTQVKTALEYYNKFILKWPTLESLSKANVEEVLIMWSGLGYYNRAKNLLKTAKIIQKKYNSSIPSNRETLLKLPGIGDYTASAIMSFAFGKYAIIVDTNIKRFLIRIFGLHSKPKVEKKEILRLGTKVFPKSNTGKFAQALMDFSSEICTKKKPNCKECFLKNYCMFDEASEINIKKINVKKKFSIVFLYIYKNKYFFLQKRSLNKILGGLYEVPGTDWKENFWPEIPKEFKDRYIYKSIVKYKFSHIHLETKIIRIEVKAKNRLQKKGIWIYKEKINKIPLSSYTKQLIKVGLNNV